MNAEDIDWLMEKGWWVSVAPVMSKGKWAWTCGVYKRGKKTGNWITEDCKTHKTPSVAFQWGSNKVKQLIEDITSDELAKYHINKNN